MRIAIVSLLAVTGCIFPSFDDMQSSARAEREDATEPTEPTTQTNAGAADDASPDAVVVTTPAPADASADVATKSPGAGKIACGDEQCLVGPNSHCCADYAANPSDHFYCASPSHTIGWCTGGGGRALFCDEQADCASGQVCCEKDSVAQCASSCTGGKVR